MESNHAPYGVFLPILLATSCWAMAGDVQTDLLRNPGSTENVGDAISKGWVTTIGVAPPVVSDIKEEGVKPPANAIQSLDQLGGSVPDETQKGEPRKPGQ